MPWYAIQTIAWEGTDGVRVDGADEAGSERSVGLSLKTQPQAIAWLLKEARSRIPDVVEMTDEQAEKIPAAKTTGAEVLPLASLVGVYWPFTIFDRKPYRNR